MSHVGPISCEYSGDHFDWIFGSDGMVWLVDKADWS